MLVQINFGKFYHQYYELYKSKEIAITNHLILLFIIHFQFMFINSEHIFLLVNG